MVVDFRNSKFAGNPLARLPRPVGDSDDLYAVLLCEARNMKGLSIGAGSDKADADLLLGHEMTYPFARDAYLSSKATPDADARSSEASRIALLASADLAALTVQNPHAARRPWRSARRLPRPPIRQRQCRSSIPSPERLAPASPAADKR